MGGRGGGGGGGRGGEQRRVGGERIILGNTIFFAHTPPPPNPLPPPPLPPGQGRVPLPPPQQDRASWLNQQGGRGGERGNGGKWRKMEGRRGKGVAKGRFVVSESSFPSCSFSCQAVRVVTVPASADWPLYSTLPSSAATWPSTTS